MMGRLRGKSFRFSGRRLSSNLLPCSSPKRPAHCQQVFLIVIDALDECDGDVNITTILRLLLRTGSKREDFGGIKLRVLVTSRPELPIQRGFKQSGGIIHLSLVLDDIARDVVNMDLTRYFTHKFDLIRSDTDYPHGPEWPGEKRISHLVHESDGLFIYASTLCRFLRSAERDGEDPDKLLFTLFGDVSEFSTKTFAKEGLSQGTFRLYRMYKQVLEHAILSAPRKREAKGEYKKARIEDYTSVIAPLVVLFHPVTLETLGKLLCTSEDLATVTIAQVKAKVLRLRSVIYVPKNEELQAKPLRVLHTSFRDFILDSERSSSRFYVAEDKAHGSLGMKCIDVMTRLLKKDICNLQDLGTLRENIGREGLEVMDFIPAELEYSCRYWVQHFSRVTSADRTLYMAEQGPISKFLRKHLLHWLEVLVLVNRMHEALLAIVALEDLADGKESPQLTALIHDSRKFMLANMSVFEKAPLQLYGSALLFAPEGSIIRKTFLSDMISTVSLRTNVCSTWGSKLSSLHFQGPSYKNLNVSSFCISPDGLKMAATHVSSAEWKSQTTRQYTVTVWNIVTGMCLLEVSRNLKYPIEVHDVEIRILQEGTKFITASAYEATVWNLKTGEVIQSGYLRASVTNDEEAPFETAYFEYVKAAQFQEEAKLMRRLENMQRMALATDEPIWYSVSDSEEGLSGSPSSSQPDSAGADSGQDTSGALDSDCVANSDDSKSIHDGDSSYASQQPRAIIDYEYFSSGESFEDGPDQECKALDALRWRNRDRTVDFSYSVFLSVAENGKGLAVLEKTTNSANRFFNTVDLRKHSQVKVWTLPSGKLVSELEDRYARDVTTISLSVDCLILATGSIDGTVHLWQLVEGEKMKMMTGAIKLGRAQVPWDIPVSSITFSPAASGTMLAAGLVDGQGFVWSHTNAQETTLLIPKSIKKNMPTVNAGDYGLCIGVDTLAFSPDGALLGIANNYSHLEIFESSAGQLNPDPLTTLHIDESRILKIAFSPSGKDLMLQCESFINPDDGWFIGVWDVSSLLDTKMSDESSREHGSRRFSPLIAASENCIIKSITISPAKTFVVTVGAGLSGQEMVSNVVKIWNMSTSYDGLPSSHKLQGKDHEISTFLHSFKRGFLIQNVAISAQESQVAFSVKWTGGGEPDWILVYDISTGQRQEIRNRYALEHSDCRDTDVVELEFSPTENYTIAFLEDLTDAVRGRNFARAIGKHTEHVSLWNISDNNTSQKLKLRVAPNSNVNGRYARALKYGLRFSPDGHSITLLIPHELIQIWSTQTGNSVWLWRRSNGANPTSDLLLHHQATARGCTFKHEAWDNGFISADWKMVSRRVHASPRDYWGQDEVCPRCEEKPLWEVMSLPTGGIDPALLQASNCKGDVDGRFCLETAFEYSSSRTHVRRRNDLSAAGGGSMNDLFWTSFSIGFVNDLYVKVRRCQTILKDKDILWIEHDESTSSTWVMQGETRVLLLPNDNRTKVGAVVVQDNILAFEGSKNGQLFVLKFSNMFQENDGDL